MGTCGGSEAQNHTIARRRLSRTRRGRHRRGVKPTYSAANTPATSAQPGARGSRRATPSTPLASYGMNTSLCALSAMRAAIRDTAARSGTARDCPAVRSPRDHLDRLRLGLRHAQPRLGLSLGRENRRLLRAFGIHNLRLLRPSARRIADAFSPSAVVTTARRVRSAVICFSIVSRISSGGVMFLSSMRITFTPHCCVALSSAARSCALVVSRDESV